MAFIPVENCAKIVIEGTVDGQQVDNDLYFRHTTGAITEADLVSLTSQIASWMGSTYAPLLNVAWQGSRVKGRALDFSFGFVAETSMVGTVGGVSGEAAPNNCSMSVSFRTSFAGRSFRGRNYVPCLTNSQVTGNVIDTGFITDVIAAYTDLIFPGVSAPPGWEWAVVSLFTLGAPRVAGVFTAVTSVIVVDNIVDSQRRRLPGRGK
jgi:hypothetical protein